MDLTKKFDSLFKAQDLIRRVWANEKDKEIGRELKNANDHLVAAINLLEGVTHD